MSKQPWALILGASSGFGEATALELAPTAMNLFGVPLDRPDKLFRIVELQQKIHEFGRDSEFFNINAALDDKRREVMEKIAKRLADPPGGTLRVLLHSLAFGALKPLAGAEEVAGRHQIELTADVMGHSLVYWVQDSLTAGLFDRGARI